MFGGSIPPPALPWPFRAHGSCTVAAWPRLVARWRGDARSSGTARCVTRSSSEAPDRPCWRSALRPVDLAIACWPRCRRHAEPCRRASSSTRHDDRCAVAVAGNTAPALGLLGIIGAGTVIVVVDPRRRRRHRGRRHVSERRDIRSVGLRLHAVGHAIVGAERHRSGSPTSAGDFSLPFAGMGTVVPLASDAASALPRRWLGRDVAVGGESLQRIGYASGPASLAIGGVARGAKCSADRCSPERLPRPSARRSTEMLAFAPPSFVVALGREATCALGLRRP